MGKLSDDALGCAKIGCLIDIIGGFLILYGNIIQFNSSSLFSFDGFQYVIIGVLIICFGLVVNFVGATFFVGAATGEAVGAIIEYTVNKIIDIFTVKEEIKLRCPSALKVLILEKKKNAVDVGIYNCKSKMSQKISFKSDLGVSDSIEVGQEIYLDD